jgi:hypothetical protein
MYLDAFYYYIGSLLLLLTYTLKDVYISFFVFWVKVCRGGAQVVVVAPHSIRSLRLQTYIGGNTERLVGVMWSSRISCGCGDLRIVKELHR